MDVQENVLEGFSGGGELSGWRNLGANVRETVQESFWGKDPGKLSKSSLRAIRGMSRALSSGGMSG